MTNASGGLEAHPWRRRVVRVTIVAAVMLGGVGVHATARADAATSARAQRVIVPVWALLDGDTPVSHARVRVYKGGPRLARPGAAVSPRPLRQRNGAHQGRTYAAGVALLEFTRLPRHFTVVVRGGRVGDRRLRGSLRAEVHGYRSATVVHVNPVTTLVARWRRMHPRVSERQATRAADRVLSIPRWADDIDLRATDRWFDGDRFFKLIRARGSVGRAMGVLIADIRHDTQTRRFRLRAASSAGLQEWWNDLDIGELVKDGFKDLGLGLAKSGAEAAGKWLLGKFLEEFGLKPVKDILLPEDPTKVMIAMLTEINRKVSELQASVESTKGAVADSQFSVLVAQTNDMTGDIDEITEKLASLAATPKDAPTRENYAATAVQDIKRQLVDTNVAAKLNRALNQPVADANDILKAASQVYGTRRFFTPVSSTRIKAVWDYFALIQFRLAVLLTNYWNTKPDTYSRATIQRSLDALDNNVVTQKLVRIKPPLPADTFVDTRTMKQWNARPPWTSGLPWIPSRVFCQGPAFPQGRPCEAAPFPVQAMPNEDDLRRLIDGFQGANPLQWLKNEALLKSSAPPGTPPSQEGYVWLGPVPVEDSSCFLSRQLVIHRVNLSADDRPGPDVFTNCLRDLDTWAYFAHAMSLQPVASGTYWWPIGGR